MGRFWCTRLNFLICRRMLWDTGLSICVQFTPFRYRCMYKRKLSLYTRPFPLSSFARCSLLLVVLSPWFYLFDHQLRSAAAAVCDDFDRRILLLFFYTENYTQTHTFTILHASVCFPSSAIWTKYTRTHTPHSLILRFAASRNMEYKLPRAFPSPSCFIHLSKLVSQRKEFCIYNIIIYEWFLQLSSLYLRFSNVQSNTILEMHRVNPTGWVFVCVSVLYMYPLDKCFV